MQEFVLLEPVVDFGHVLFDGVKSGFGAHFVRPPHVDADDRVGEAKTIRSLL